MSSIFRKWARAEGVWKRRSAGRETAVTPLGSKMLPSTA